MSATSERVRRLLSLVPYLRTHPGVSIERAAEEFGVTRTQLEKDLWLLFTDCGLPGYLPDDLIDIDFGPDGIWVREDAGLRRPMRLTADEALALTVAVRALREAAGPAEAVAIDGVLARLDAALGTVTADGAGADVVAISLPAPGPEETVVRGRIGRALAGSRALRMHYRSVSRDAEGERTVDPLGLLERDGNTYLVAWCRSARDVRRFRTDRMDAVEVLDEPARPPADLPIPREPFTPRPDHEQVRLRLRPDAVWVVEFFGCTDVSACPDGTVLATMAVADVATVVRLVLGTGDAVRVEGPESVRRAVAGAARDAVLAYQEPWHQEPPVVAGRP